MCGLISSCAPETVSLTLIGLVWMFFSDLAFSFSFIVSEWAEDHEGLRHFSLMPHAAAWSARDPSCVLYLPLIRAGPCVFNKNSPVEIWCDRCQYFYLFIFNDPSNLLIKHLWRRYIMEARYFTAATNFIVYNDISEIKQ